MVVAEPQSAPMRVLVACSGLGHVFRGFETASAEVAEALRGHVDVTVARGGGAWRDEHGVRLPCVQRFGPIAGKLLKLQGPSAYLVEQRSFAPWAYLIARLGHYDIVHLHDPGLLNAFWHARRVAGGRFAIVFTNGGPLGPEHLGRPDLVQSVTPVDARALEQAGFADTRVAMVPHGIWPSAPPPRAFADGPPTKLLGVGVVNDSHKGFRTAIRAAALLAGAELRLLGQRDGETRDIEALGRQLLGPRFSIDTVPRDRVAAEITAADIFVLPTHYEGFCIAVLEAMDAGIPCVVSDIPVFRWLVGDAGVLVPPDAPEQWAAALRGLTPARRGELSERGRRRAADFHWPRLVGDYLGMYRKVLGWDRR
jgi:1,2-diacylglycerol 3-alpha-glucosyltransferase